MTMIVAAAIGLALVLVLLLVESIGLVRIVRRCDADTKKKWKAAILSQKAAHRDLRAARRAGDGEAVVESQLAVTRGREARKACGDVRKKVGVQAAELRKQRREPLDEAESDIENFPETLWKATLGAFFSPTVAGVVGSVLLLVLALIEVRYYELFDFNVLPYLPDYPAPALLVGLLQVLLLLGLLPLIFAAFVVIVPPWAGLLLIMLVDGLRALAAKGIAWVFFAACGRWEPCSYLALSLLDEGSAGSTPKSDGTYDRPLVEPAISFVKKCGAWLILTDGTDSTDSRSSLTVVSKFAIAILLLFVCYIAVDSEPLYQFHATCGKVGGARSVRVVLPGGDNFTRIGSIGGNVFIVPESCGLQSQTADEEDEGEQPSGDAGHAETASEGESDGGGGDGGETAPAEGLRSVVDQIQGRLQFFGFLDPDDPDDPDASRDSNRRHPIDVTVVPLGRVLCMYEVRDDQSNESAACRPLSQSTDPNLQIIVRRETTDNTWTIVLPPDVRMDDEWRLKAEIARRVCDGGAAEISEPIVFEREQVIPADEPAARATIEAFLNKPELQDVDELHVLGFASGDGDSRYNENLARQRAKAVATMVPDLDPRDPRRTPSEDSWGENHLTSGVANNRSARIVGCRQEAGTSSSDTSGQQARAVTSEPLSQEKAVVRWPI